MRKIEEKPIIFPNSRKEKLWGVLSLPAKKRKFPGLLVCHGFGSSKSGRKYVNLSRVLAQKGIAVFRFDFSGHGDSEGDFEKISIEKEVKDLKAAFETFIRVKSIDKKRIAILGHSLGALVAVLFQTQYKKAKTLILLSPALHQRELMKGWHKSEEVKRWQKKGYLDTPKGRIGIQYFRETQKKDWPELALQIKIPTLLLHGEQDNDVPLKYSEELIKKLSGPKKLVVVKDAEHHFESYQASRKLVRLSLDWLKKYL